MGAFLSRGWKVFFGLLCSVPVNNRFWVKLANLPFSVVSGTQVKWDPHRGLFKIVSDGQVLLVARRNRLGMYLKGINHRLSSLEKEYRFADIGRMNGRGVGIDVGANVGEVSIIMARAGISVLAVEPDDMEFAALKENAHGSIASINCALWKEDGLRTFFLANESGDSSLIEPSRHRGATKVSQTRTLDSIVSETLDSRTPVAVLKLEAEGAEPEVLMGAVETLRKVEWVLVDVGFERGPSEESTLPEVAQILISSGFEFISIGKDRLVAVFRNYNVSARNF